MFFMKPKKKNNALKIIAIIAGCVAAVAAIAVVVTAICKKKCKKNECCDECECDWEDCEITDAIDVDGDGEPDVLLVDTDADGEADTVIA